MHRFDHPLRLDNLLFLLALVVTAVFIVDQFLEQEREKTSIAQASAWRRSGVARALAPCPPLANQTSRSDASDPCLPTRTRKK
jgi:hypothetical protein